MSKAYNIATSFLAYQDTFTDYPNQLNIGTANVTTLNAEDSITANTATLSQNWKINGIDDVDGQLAIYNGATKLWGITEGGYVVNPNVPAFHAHGIQGRTTISSGSEFPLQATSYNNGNHFNTSTYRFTAPFSGFYSFQYGAYCYVSLQTAIKKNGADWTPSDTTGLCTVQSTEINGAAISMYLVENDYVSFGLRAAYSGDVYLSHTWLSGFLVG